uniref:Disintegrin domain-containing protein n=1 Tax=Panagrellus redivivus TaxID=6233 RepID=A0A7E4W062_PANRE
MCWSHFGLAAVSERAEIEYQYISPDKLEVSLTRFDETFDGTLKERINPLTDIIIIGESGVKLQIAEESKGRIFNGHIEGCPQCKITVIWFADVDLIYGIFDFIHHKLYIEPSNVDGRDHDSYHVSQIPQDRPAWSRQKYIKNTKIPLSFYVDVEFYQLFGGDHLAVYRYLIANVEFVTHIYKPVNFGLTEHNEHMQGLNFALVKIVIEDDKRKYNYGHDELVNVRTLSDSFETVVDSSDVCLAVFITGRIGIGGVLGISIIGNEDYGICAKTSINGMFYNTVVLAIKSDDTFEPVFDTHRTFAHEIGHSFGAQHDDKYFVEIHFDTIMAAVRPSGNIDHHFMFLPQAKISMAVRLHKILHHLEPSGHISNCGNGVVDLTEQCDPGSDGTDQCCAKTCELRADAKCSPIHENCCTEDCNFAPSTTKCPIQPDNKTLTSFCTGTSTACTKGAVMCDDSDDALDVVADLKMAHCNEFDETNEMWKESSHVLVASEMVRWRCAPFDGYGQAINFIVDILNGSLENSIKMLLKDNPLSTIVDHGVLTGDFGNHGMHVFGVIGREFDDSTGQGFMNDLRQLGFSLGPFEVPDQHHEDG